jgi:hypothetical protein
MLSQIAPKELLLYVSGLVKRRLNIQFVYEKKGSIPPPHFLKSRYNSEARKYKSISEQREGEKGDMEEYMYTVIRFL